MKGREGGGWEIVAAFAKQGRLHRERDVLGARMEQGGVGCLNISVATAILCDALLRKENTIEHPETQAEAGRHPESRLRR